MKLIMYGINQDTVSREDIQIQSYNEESKRSQLEKISSFDGVEEIVILQNIYRIEYYLYVDEKAFKHGDLLRYLSDFFQKQLNEVILETYSYFNEDVIRHLFNFAASVECPTEIPFEHLKDITDAYEFSADNGKIRGPLADLFQQAMNFGYHTYLASELIPIYTNHFNYWIKSLNSFLDDGSIFRIAMIGYQPETPYYIRLALHMQIRELTLIIDELTEGYANEIEKIPEELLKDVSINFRRRDEMAYPLANADLIFDFASFFDIISPSEQDQICQIRRTPKNQMVLNPKMTHEVDQLPEPFQLISPLEMSHDDYSSEEIQEAQTFYDQILSSKISDYMNTYEIEFKNIESSEI